MALRALRDGFELRGVPDAAVTDAALTSTLLRYAGTELGQRVRPSAIDRFWAIEPPRRDVAAELGEARRTGALAAWLGDLSPRAPAYAALRAAACRYRLLVDNGGWKPLAKGPALRAADRGPAIEALRRRLALEGYGAETGGDRGLFDPDLRAEVQAFQRTHDLPQTGSVDTATRAAMNVPAEMRLAQIQANLERWRWLPHALPPDRLEVDVGSATVTLVADGAPVLEMKAIVGHPAHRTPMFASRLTAVVFDPPWNVPAEIATREILPKAAKDPGYLARENMVWVDGHLQQRPGPKNSLGLIKFDLPSPFGVYLHDTPAKSLFARRNRALSHGCMRLEKPQALAETLLAPQGWTSGAVAAAMAAGRTQAVPLRRSLPLYVVYWTVGVGQDREIVFRPDVYGWDRKLAQALARTAPPTGAPPQGCGGASR